MIEKFSFTTLMEAKFVEAYNLSAMHSVVKNSMGLTQVETYSLGTNIV